ncbi:hypothetical protein H0H92_008510 [Tricholoma furcatifolium]|nr:hypothetical protein H0H92_008510 [Tricholoma furcatifolium]
MSLAGWYPAKGSEDDDLCLPQSDHSPAAASQVAQTDVLPTSTELTDSLSLEITPSSSDTEPIRRGDPNWAPRPSNGFIIFRCEYSRKHAKQGKRIRRRPGTTRTEKSLSKLAGEAWRQLSDEERNRYKELAGVVKEEHARLYPDYRFRPVKKKAGLKKSASLSKLASDPLVSSTAGGRAISSPSSQIPPLSSTPPPPPPSVLDMVATKANRRRSRSFPSLPLNHSGIPEEWLPGQSTKPTMKRSKSVVGDRPPPLLMLNTSTPTEAPSFDLGTRERSISFAHYVLNQSSSAARDDPPSTFTFPGNSHLNGVSSPLATSPSSSLTDWNGNSFESVPSWMPSPVEELESLDLYSSATDYTSVNPTADPSLAEIMSNYGPDASYPGATLQFISHKLATQTALGLESSGALFSPAVLYNASSSLGRSSYLPERTQSVDSYAIENYEAAMYGLNLDDYIHYSQ